MRKKQWESDLITKDKKFIWHPFTQMKDWLDEEILIIEKGRGVYLQATNGRQYLDGVSSLWTNVHGHANRYLDRAVKRQLGKISHTTFLGLSHPPAIELAAKLVQLAPAGLKKVFYSNSGSEAVEIALKIAFQYWQNKGEKQKKKFVSLQAAYHGDTIGSVSVGGIDLFHRIYKPLLFKSIQVPSPYCYRCPSRCGLRELRSWQCVRQLETVLRAQHQQIIALIIEPLVQGAGGMIVAPRGYLRKVRELCSRYQVLLIADEVATGFGRTGKMFACQHEGVKPDIMALAKGLSGGYLPLAATLVTKEIFDSFLAPYEKKRTFFHGHTYTANPLCCAVSLASIDLLEKSVLKKLPAKISLLHQRLQKFWALTHVGDIRQCGLLAGIELVKNKKTKAPYPYQTKIGIKVIQEARRRGVIIRPLGNTIVIMPPLVISQEELNRLLAVIYESIKLVTG